MSVFYPIRTRIDRIINRHEASHAAAVLALCGVGKINYATIDEVSYRTPPSDEDRLVVLAAGIRGAQRAGAVGLEHGGGSASGRGDTAKAFEIMKRFPDGGIPQWQRALSRAAQIVADRWEFIDALADLLEREQKISGDRVDALWRQFYPQAVPATVPRQRSYSTRSFDEEIVYEDGVAVGVVRRHSLDGGFVAFA